MSKRRKKISRRSLVQVGGMAGAAGLGAAADFAHAQSSSPGSKDAYQAISETVSSTPIVDTHEHLLEESSRLGGTSSRIKSNDWSFLLSHYLNSDLLTCGMPEEDLDRFFGSEVDPVSKWTILEPYWPRVRHTGYGQAVEIAIRKLYGVENLSGENVSQIARAYRDNLRKGFYRRVLQEIGGIESCQVNSLEAPFNESEQPLLLMQDLSILGMHMGPDIDAYAPRTGVTVQDLDDWHRVIDWWFESYGRFAVAVKSQAAYSRNIDYSDVPADQASPVFKARMAGDPVTDEEKKRLEDHLFWYCVRKATEFDLPIKIHTGYYAGQNRMPLGRLQGNAAAAAELCRSAPDSRFIFMHINYPFYEELIALAKQYTNCNVDMCWAWIISPVAAVNFLKQYLVTAPANKVLTFGGDYIPVEPVIGHVALARRGISRALYSLVDEGWLTLKAACDLVEALLRGNAHDIFRLSRKTTLLKTAPWTRT